MKSHATMRVFVAVALALVWLISQPAFAQKTVHVKPYTKRDGTQVRGHDRRAPQKRGSTTTEGGTTMTTPLMAQGPLVPEVPPSGPASALVGVTDDHVLEKLGSPSLTDPTTWHYDSSRGTLRLTFHEGKVTEVRPSDFDLAALAEVTHEPTPALIPEPERAPAGAVAKCGNGQYIFVWTEKACVGYGGVAQRLKK